MESQVDFVFILLLLYFYFLLLETPFFGLFLGPFVWATFSEIHPRLSHFGAGLINLGATLTSNIGIFSINRPEWILTDLTCSMHSLISVPLYDTLGEVRFAYLYRAFH